MEGGRVGQRNDRRSAEYPVQHIFLAGTGTINFKAIGGKKSPPLPFWYVQLQLYHNPSLKFKLAKSLPQLPSWTAWGEHNCTVGVITHRNVSNVTSVKMHLSNKMHDI